MNRTIAYLTSEYARAGDTFIRREVEELRRRGFTVHTFSIRRADEGAHIPEDILREQRTTDYILEHGAARLALSFLWMSLRFPGRMLRAAAAAGALRRPGLRSLVWHGFYLLEASYLAEQLVARGAFLLHDHISMNSATVALLASTLTDIPFSMTVHGPHDFLEAEHWSLGRKVALSFATVAISDFGKSQCMLFTPPEHWNKLHVVRCGLDRKYLENPAPPPPDSRRLLCVGRLSPEKGQVLLVEAAAHLRDHGLSVEIVLIGDGPSRVDIERTAHQRGVQELIRLVGWQSSDEVRRWMLESRAIVLPSLAEGIPVVLMEAMALGRPVIATYVGGVPELVRPGVNGFLVPAGSVASLVEAMREVLGMSSEDIDRMGQRGRQEVLERHTSSVEVEKLAGLFEDALAKKGTAGTP